MISLWWALAATVAAAVIFFILGLRVGAIVGYDRAERMLGAIVDEHIASSRYLAERSYKEES